jgi:hypothetical protein
MAEFDIERRPRRSAAPWIIGLLVLAAVAVGAWILLSGGDEVERETVPAAETRGVPGPEADGLPGPAPATADDGAGTADPGLEPVPADPSGPDDEPTPLPADTLGGG